MPSCAFDKCRNHSRKENKSHGITFHTFPQDELWCHKWLRVVRKQRQEPEWSPTNHSRVCSLHFKPEDMYTTGKGMKRIKNGAVPFFQKPQKAAKPIKTSSDPLDSDDSDQSSAITDEEPSPNKFILRKVQKILADKKRLLQLNQNLKRKNKRLAVKCKQYREILVTLRDKIGLLESKIAEKDSG